MTIHFVGRMVVYYHIIIGTIPTFTLHTQHTHVVGTIPYLHSHTKIRYGTIYTTAYIHTARQYVDSHYEVFGFWVWSAILP